MADIKEMIKKKLTTGILISVCQNSEKIIFDPALCSHEGTVRFTTSYFRSMLEADAVIYEVEFVNDKLEIKCVFHPDKVPGKFRQEKSYLLKLADKDYILEKWYLSASENAGEALSLFIENDLPAFEQKTENKIDKLKNNVFIEGEMKPVTLTKYERNKKAREACLEANGTACKICGIDFGTFYGPAFAGKIEVHHIVPISEIGENYQIDPVNDLIPVCPNCHMILHSKPDGCYTPEEIKDYYKKN